MRILPSQEKRQNRKFFFSRVILSTFAINFQIYLLKTDFEII